MLPDKLKKFLAFEWVMVWIFGFFWAGVMSFPLFLTGAFDNKAAAFENFMIIAGPYLLYLACRLLFLIGYSVYWAYLTSNFFFTHQGEKIFAEEWYRFVMFFIVWAIVLAYPMHKMEMFTSFPSGIIVLTFVFPYAGYLLARMLWAFLRSFGWSVRVATKK